MNWEDEYLMNMFGPLHDLVSMDRASIIKYEHMPERLFKFRTIKDNTLEALQNSVLFSSPPSKLNDPREVPIYIDTNKILGKSLQGIYDLYRQEHTGISERVIHGFHDVEDVFFEIFGEPDEVIPELLDSVTSDQAKEEIITIAEITCRNYIEGLKASSKQRYNICSFSANLNNSPMWCHYSGDHSGFCIEYNFKELGITNDYVQLLLPVLYREKSLEVEEINVIDSSFCMFAFTIKDKTWSYEEEWRLFSSFSEEPVALKMPKAKAVYAGINIDKSSDLEKLKTICSTIEVSLFQMEDSSKGLVVGKQIV